MVEKKEEQVRKFSRWLLPLFIGLLSILIRIPKLPYIYGYDGFEVIWMAFAINNGALVSDHTWLIHPLSYFGFYPFSQYPIALPLLLAGLLSINISLSVSIVMVDFLLTIVCAIGAYKLSSLLFRKEIFRNLFLIMVLFGSKDFYNYTYFSLHPRGVLLALSFWFLYYLLKFKEEESIKNKIFSIIKILVVFTLMVLSYRISVMYLLYLIPFVFQIIVSSERIKRFTKKIIENRITEVFFLLLSIGMMVLGFIITPDFDVSLWSPISDSRETTSQIISLGMVYFSNLGVLLIFLPIGLLSIFFSRKEVDFDRRPFLLVIVSLIALSWKIPVYSIVLFLPIYVWISVLGIKQSVSFLRKKGCSNKFSFLLCASIVGLSAVVVHVIYISIIVYVRITYFVVLVAIGGYGLFFIVKRYLFGFKRMQWVLVFMFIILTSNILFLQTAYEGQENYASLWIAPYSLNYSQNHITNDELLVIEYIKSEGINGTILTSSTTLSRRIGGAGFLPTIPGYHTEHPLYYGWIPADLVINNTYFSFYGFVETFSLVYNGSSYEDQVLSQIRGLNITRSYTIDTLVSLNIQYIVAIKNTSNDTIYPYLFHPYGRTDYFIFESLNNLAPSFNTSFLAVWKIY
ncbi:MAG: hypothetical protein HGN29_11480 [Asgard group archaeon]|nr:hypothetical protein [Asgard group archaeon]